MCILSNLRTLNVQMILYLSQMGIQQQRYVFIQSQSLDKNIQWHAMASVAPAKLTKNVLFIGHYRATSTKQLEYPFFTKRMNYSFSSEVLTFISI